MQNCLTCKNTVYDEQQDEYICKARNATIFILLDAEDCKSYERGEEIKS